MKIVALLMLVLALSACGQDQNASCDAECQRAGDLAETMTLIHTGMKRRTVREWLEAEGQRPDFTSRSGRAECWAYDLWTLCFVDGRLVEKIHETS